MVRIKTKVKIDIRKLKAIPAKVERGITNGLKKGAGEVARKAQRFAPHDTGQLMRSIFPDGIEKPGNITSISISPHVNYAAKMEQPGNVRRRGRRPYMRPALQQSIPKIVFHIRNEIKKAIK